MPQSIKADVTIVFEPWNKEEATRHYHGPFNENVQVFIDEYCETQGAATIQRQGDYPIYQHKAMRSQKVR